MNENDTITNDKWNIDSITEILHSKFDIEIEYIGDGKLGIEEFNGYIDSEEQFDIIEDLAESLCDWLRIRFDNDFDYELLSQGYELVLEII